MTENVSRMIDLITRVEARMDEVGGLIRDRARHTKQLTNKTPATKLTK